MNLAALFAEFNLELCHRLLQNETEKLFNPNITDVRIETVPTPSSDVDNTMGEIRDHVTSEDQLEETLAVSFRDST